MSARDMREACARIAKNGAVAAFQQATAAQDDEVLYHTRTDVFDAIGKALSECQRQIESLPLAPAPSATTADDAVARARERVVSAAVEQRRLAVESFHNRFDNAAAIAYEASCEATQNAVASLLAAERAAKGNNEGGGDVR